MKYKAAVFDLDGTLADTLESIATAANKTLNILGYQNLPTENYKYYAGDGAKALMLRVLKDSGDVTGSRLDEMAPIYADVFEEYCMYKVQPYAGIPELIRSLKDMGMKIAVLTNKPHKRALDVLADLFAPKTFDFIQGQSDDIPRKPDPAGAFMIADALKIAPEECIYLGDTDTDMQTGRAAGMFTIGVLWGFRDEQELISNGAQALVKTPADVTELLKGESDNVRI